MYAFHENFVLPLSHDEVSHGKGSLLGKMAGDEWQQFANLRLLYGLMFAQPGKKLLFMGAEFTQVPEWSATTSIEWHLQAVPRHKGIEELIAALNSLYASKPALHERDVDARGFEWIDANDAENSALSFARRGHNDERQIVIVCNFTPVVRHNYRVGVNQLAPYREVLNTDSQVYGGSGVNNLGAVQASTVPHHGRGYSIEVTLPPLAAVYFEAAPPQ